MLKSCLHGFERKATTLQDIALEASLLYPECPWSTFPTVRHDELQDSLYLSQLIIRARPAFSSASTYHIIKHKADEDYQRAREALHGDDAPFSGWMISGANFESFNTEAIEIHSTDEQSLPKTR